MFETDDVLTYLDSGEEVTVTEVHERHIVVITNDDTEEYFDIYEDEYDKYQKVTQ